MRKIESDIRELREQLNGYENSKFRLGQKIEGLKGQMKWDQQVEATRAFEKERERNIIHCPDLGRMDRRSGEKRRGCESADEVYQR